MYAPEWADRERGVVRILAPPELESTHGTVALDGTPTPELWRLALGIDLTHRRVLTDGERREYLEDALGLQIAAHPDVDERQVFNILTDLVGAEAAAAHELHGDLALPAPVAGRALEAVEFVGVELALHDVVGVVDTDHSGYSKQRAQSTYSWGRYPA